MAENSASDHTGNIAARASAIAAAGSLEAAIAQGKLPTHFECCLCEALVLGLLKQGVRKYLAIFGHGSTQLGEILRIYEDAGVTRTFQFRNEVAMAHAATALSWIHGEVPALVTSIGPGALQAMAGSLVAASNGVGVYHIYGDETTHGEGYNMQQIPGPAQGAFGALTAIMGRSYTLHTPEALREALRQGLSTVRHPTRAAPFYLLLPINTQPKTMQVNLAALPVQQELPSLASSDQKFYDKAAALIGSARNIIIKAGGGTRRFCGEVTALAEKSGAAVVLSPHSSGVLPDAHRQNMHVGGSKGSISGNYAMENADLLIVIGARAVCQSDCSGIGYPRVKSVININADSHDALHYNHTVPLLGDIGMVISRLNTTLDGTNVDLPAKKPWLDACAAKKAVWATFKEQQYDAGPQQDRVWGRPVLTQPQAIKVAVDFADTIDALKLFDAGDVQANGFQIVEDDRPDQTVTETGASYMGFAVSALTAGAIAGEKRPQIAFTGDGSFFMNPQILIDAVEHGLKATIVIFDNRRMAAITNLQRAQYAVDFRTSDSVAVNYVQLASAVRGVMAFDGGDSKQTLQAALQKAHQHDGLSVVHVPVYADGNATEGMGSYGSWNVGNWCDAVQTIYAKQSV